MTSNLVVFVQSDNLEGHNVASLPVFGLEHSPVRTFPDLLHSLVTLRRHLTTPFDQC